MVQLTAMAALMLACVAGLSTGTVRGEDPPAATMPLRFETDVMPILQARCVKCHSGDRPKGGLRLDEYHHLMRGGSSGPVIRRAAAESSLLWARIASQEMPAEGPPLTAEEKGFLRTWINDGAQGPHGADPESGDDDPVDAGAAGSFWSFRPPVRSPLPTVRDAQRIRSPVDAFMIARLEARDLSLSPEANRVVLVRRAYFDLLGIPPSPAEIDAFLADADSMAYERLIDNLLASPRYGERWGRIWLDVAGYADSAGVLAEDRPLPRAYRYRDYVIRAFNADKPYDRFLQEQLAGDELTGYWRAYEQLDELPDEVIEGVTATGYLRCAADASRPDFSTIKNADAQYFYPTLNDTLQIVASSTLGLTLQCARCHSHKYDPIPQAEYYRLQAIFMGALRPTQWIPQMERVIPVASASQVRQAKEHNGRIDAEVARRKQELQELRTSYQNRLLEERLATLPESIRPDVRRAITTAADQRHEVAAYLAEKFQAFLQPDDKTRDKLLPETYPEYRKEVERKQRELAEQERGRIAFDELRALYDLPGEIVTPVLRRGDPLTPGPAVEPGVLTAIAAPVPFQWTPPEAEAKTSGRRLAFARWLTQPGHPLTARVLVNRVWLNHFGEGLVSTPEDFGETGSRPSHPELLDWLACEFMAPAAGGAPGWSIKRLHRLIMTSSVYRQSAQAPASLQAVGERADPDNRLLWKQRLRRLDAESLRDAVLQVSGELDGQMFGSPVPVARHPDGEVTIAAGANTRRRSVYLQVLRSNPLTLLQVFDQPVMETNCLRRVRSTVATQALTLLNSGTMVAAAAAFAERVDREFPTDVAAGAVRMAFAREAGGDEQQLLERFLETQRAQYVQLGMQDVADRRALADLCHMLLVSNEFVYID